MNKPLPPFHRGIIGFLSRTIRTTYIARGGRSFLSIPFSWEPKLFFCLLFVYDVEKDTAIYLASDSKGKVTPLRFFVRSAFPYLSLRHSHNAYKCLNIFLSFIPSRDSGRLEVKKCDQAEPHILFEYAVSDKDIQPQTIEQIEATILSSQRDQFSTQQLANLEASIWRLRPSASNHDVEKTLILFYAKFLLNHRRTRKLLKRWLAFETNEAGSQVVEDFQNSLEAVTDPLALGPHGYNPSFKKLDLDSVEGELHGLMAEFTKQGVTPFLNSGTLLGYYRDGAPIPHDDDFDLGILVAGTSDDEIAGNWKAFLGWLKQNYPTTIKGSFAATYLANGVQIDVFPAWIINEKVYVYPYCWEDVHEDALIPTSSLEIRNRSFLIPAKPEDVLAVNYGPNWRVPDPFWRFDYSVSRKRFADVLQKLKS